MLQSRPPQEKRGDKRLDDVRALVLEDEQLFRHSDLGVIEEKINL